MKAIKLLFILISITGFAQSKVGTVDVDYIISLMPEIPSIQKQVSDYATGLDGDFNKNVAAYNVLTTAYAAGEAGFTPEVIKQKQEEILKAEKELNQFQQNGTKLINIKRDELLRPLYQKIGVSLEKLSKTENFTQVLQITEALVYIDPEFDLTLKILKDLGIEVKAGQ